MLGITCDAASGASHKNAILPADMRCAVTDSAKQIKTKDTGWSRVGIRQLSSASDVYLSDCNFNWHAFTDSTILAGCVLTFWLTSSGSLRMPGSTMEPSGEPDAVNSTFTVICTTRRTRVIHEGSVSEPGVSEDLLGNARMSFELGATAGAWMNTAGGCL